MEPNKDPELSTGNSVGESESIPLMLDEASKTAAEETKVNRENINGENEPSRPAATQNNMLQRSLDEVLGIVSLKPRHLCLHYHTMIHRFDTFTRVCTCCIYTDDCGYVYDAYGVLSMRCDGIRSPHFSVCKRIKGRVCIFTVSVKIFRVVSAHRIVLPISMFVPVCSCVLSLSQH